MATRQVKVWVETMVEVDLEELETNAPHLWPEQQTDYLIQLVLKSIEEKNFQLTHTAIIPKDTHASNEDYSSFLVEPENEFEWDDFFGVFEL